MPRIKWTPSALDDVLRLYRFLAKKNISAAQKAIKAIRENLNILVQHPEIGRPVDFMDVAYRECVIPYGHSGYLALYNYDGETVVILTVRHQAEVGYPLDITDKNTR
ncbi:MAG: type II toxin-antitoxin system RelE/ParE family toxin [Desulfobulbaceae bacterium]|nr:type II toxin-antitoxin system RelE/ParE family toxin [Desulfobulbaceae bacterium]